MVKETRFIGVEPSETEDTIDLYQKFGWVLVSAPQEVLSQTSGTSHLERRGNSVYSVKTAGTTTHYVRITLQRNKNMPNYAELVKLEEAYNTKNYVLPSQPIKPSGFSIMFVVIPIIISFLCMWVYRDLYRGFHVGGVLVVGIVLAVVGIVLAIFRAVNKTYKTKAFARKYSGWESTCAAIKHEDWKKKQEILRMAESLLT
jgi:asparagine N-glycosylation enzyme membrane subunit Stt3